MIIQKIEKTIPCDLFKKNNQVEKNINILSNVFILFHSVIHLDDFVIFNQNHLLQDTHTQLFCTSQQTMMNQSLQIAFKIRKTTIFHQIQIMLLFVYLSLYLYYVANIILDAFEFSSKDYIIRTIIFLTYIFVVCEHTSSLALCNKIQPICCWTFLHHLDQVPLFVI